MRQKFAKIDFAAKREEIPVKYGLLRQSGNRMMDWYIKKYNPFTTTSINVAGESGYAVRLPLTASDAKNDYEMTVHVWENTIRALKDYNVTVILPPKNLPFEPKGVKLADGALMLPFLLSKALKKLLAYSSQTIFDKEIVLVGTNDTQSFLSVQNIYPEINYLCLLVANADLTAFRQLSKHIFEKTGLEITVTENEAVIGNADIIVNTRKNVKLTSHLKKGAVFIDLSGDVKTLSDIMRRRPDVLFIDSVDIKYGQNVMSINDLEMMVYVKSPDYRQLLTEGYNDGLAAAINAFINTEHIEIERFFSLTKPVPLSFIKKIL